MRTIKSSLSTIVSYPELLQHEESLNNSQGGAGSVSACFDVMSWMAYLESLDDVLDILKEAHENINKAGGGGAPTSKKDHVARTTTLEAAGRTFRISPTLAPGITHTPAQFTKEIKQLIQARVMVGERSVSLLPGSYKLWKNHLTFLTGLLGMSDANNKTGGSSGWDNKELQKIYNHNRIPSYLLTASSKFKHYHAAVSAFERSLVRLHKMPRLWLMYATFVVLYDPERNPTTVRNIYDRALVALPASQHERIWEEYLCWVTGILPSNSSSSSNGEGGLSITRKGIHKVKYGFESPLVAEWRKRGWGNGQLQSENEYIPTVPAETALRILRRYAQCFDTTFREDLATLCITRYERFGEAASLLLQLLNNQQPDGSSSGGGAFLSPNGTTRHELWLRFADVCTAHPAEAKVAGVDFDGIIRAVLKGQDVRSDGSAIAAGGNDLGFKVFDNTSTAFGASEDDNQQQTKEADNNSHHTFNHCLGEMEGTLWTRLAEYHVRAGDFELARSVYEEALDAITRVRDFSLVFDAYVRFEEGVIEALMELMEDEDEEGSDDQMKDDRGDSMGDENEDLDILLGDNVHNALAADDNPGASADVELAISRAENLTSRRPLLLNRVLLRQNPHNVGEWIKRSNLYLDLGEVDMAAAALEESLKAVSSRKAVNGSPSTLILTLVDIHENQQKNVDAARNLLERICSKNAYEFQDSEDLAQCHAAWVELELRQENWDMSLELARRAVSGNIGRKGSKAARGLSRSLRLWNLLFDMEESLGTIQTTKDAYDRALEWKVATPSHVLNYASFLKEKKYFEESFAAYERGLGLFAFPHAGATLLWKNYLTDFLERYEGSKTPRVRELFDRCLAECPSENASEFYLLYGEYEENHGLTKRALGVYERMCNAVPASEKYTAYRLYIAKAIQYLGVTSARPIYEAAISTLGDGPASRICLEYAKMETGLRETDRARAVLVYGAQLADPRRDPDYWKAWHEFEVSHGNEETFREMLRVKRSVQAAFSTVNYNSAEMGAGAPKVETLTEESALEMIAKSEGVEVDSKKQPLIGGFVQGKRKAEVADLGEVERRAARLRQATAAPDSGGDEIDIDDIDDDEDEEEAPSKGVKSSAKGVSEKAVPAAVFGGLASSIEK
jgi:pre-mRNA-splicing factor SYF1